MDELTLRVLADDRNFRKYLFMEALKKLGEAIRDRQRGLKNDIAD